MLPLNCGFYSRSFNTLDPALFIASTTDQKQTGSKESGIINLAYTKNRGSLIPANFYLDGITTNVNIVSPISVAQSDAMLSVATGLFGFLTTAVGVFNATGASYPQIQIQIQNNITSLIEQATSLNQTLQLQQVALNQAQEVFKVADESFHDDCRCGCLYYFLCLLCWLLQRAVFHVVCVQPMKKNPKRLKWHIVPTHDCRNCLSVFRDASESIPEIFC